MNRYIDADVARRIIDSPRSKEQMLLVLSQAEPADVVEVKHGRWIKDRLCSTSGGTYGVRRCSVCEHYFQDLVNEYNYCPHCGADMRERGEDEEIH